MIKLDRHPYFESIGESCPKCHSQLYHNGSQGLFCQEHGKVKARMSGARNLLGGLKCPSYKGGTLGQNCFTDKLSYPILQKTTKAMLETADNGGYGLTMAEFLKRTAVYLDGNGHKPVKVVAKPKEVKAIVATKSKTQFKNRVWKYGI